MSLDITVTDMFCGASGSSIGAEAAGARLRFAANHWAKAVETHNANFQDADHECADCWPELDVDDCRFRMFEPHEIGRAMAFRDNYYLAATTKKDKVKLYGNAVTPPVMSWLFEQAIESLA